VGGKDIASAGRQGRRANGGGVARARIEEQAHTDNHRQDDEKGRTPRHRLPFYCATRFTLTFRRFSVVTFLSVGPSVLLYVNASTCPSAIRAFNDVLFRWRNRKFHVLLVASSVLGLPLGKVMSTLSSALLVVAL